MFLAALILVLSVALFCFHLQCVCQRIVRREFDQPYFQSIVRLNRLEFPWVRQWLESPDPLQYAKVRAALRSDFRTLLRLVKTVSKPKPGYSTEERLLILCFRGTCWFLFLLHALRLREKRAILAQTNILEHFANLVGQRANLLRLGNIGASDSPA